MPPPTSTVRPGCSRSPRARWLVSDPEGIILSGSTTTAGTGAFGSAWIPRGGDLQLWTTCVAASRLQGATTASVTMRTNQTSTWRYYTKQATCPDGTVAYGGGGNVVTSGVYDAQGLYTYGTVPDGTTWTYAGTGALGTRSLVVETHCRPGSGSETSASSSRRSPAPT